MLDCMDYFTETSNDDKLPFLELIEAVSRSHRDSLSNDARYLNTNDIYNYTISSQLDLCISSAGHESLKYCTSMEGDDNLNMTDCDLNLLVDPRTGKPLDDDEEEEEKESEKLEVCVKIEKPDDDLVELKHDEKLSELIDTNSSDLLQSKFKFCPVFSNDEITDTSTQFNSLPILSHFNTLPIKKEIVDEPIQTEDNITLNNNNNNNTNNNNNNNNNRVVLIQISSPSSNITKLNNSENLCPQTFQIKPLPSHIEKYDKPPFSYSCLIAMALKNSENGYLPVSEIYSYIIEKFPYFKTAPDGWKNSIRHNLSLNKCFQKLETPSLNGTTRKACLWGLNEAKVSRLNDEISKWVKKGNDINGKRFCSSPESTTRHFINKPMLLNEDAQHCNIMSDAITDSWMSNNFSPPSSHNNHTSVDPAEFKLYKLVKVSKNNESPLDDKIESSHNELGPVFDNIGNQTFSWDDLLETSELRSFTLSPLANQRVTFRSRTCNDPPLSLNATVLASA